MNTPQEIFKEVRDGLVLTLTVGAAKEDIGADRVYLKGLAAALVPGIEAYGQTGNVSFALDAIQRVMGPEWKPSGEWAQYIDAALALDGLKPGNTGK